MVVNVATKRHVTPFTALRSGDSVNNGAISFFILMTGFRVKRLAKQRRMGNVSR
jgi:hypothetical protein